VSVPSVEPVEDIEFIDSGRLVDGDLELRLVGTTSADHERGFAPAYRFEMVGATSGAVMGNINLRVGQTEHLRLYRGHIGFGVLEPFRGNRLALRSCRLLAGLAIHHSLVPVWLTCDGECRLSEDAGSIARRVRGDSHDAVRLSLRCLLSA
jgi:hypothetical protein